MPGAFVAQFVELSRNEDDWAVACGACEKEPFHSLWDFLA